MSYDIHIMRVYDHEAHSKGARILVDRLWPRGIKKEDLHLDDWLHDIAPSNTLRKWFDHDPKKWPEFRKKFVAELDDNPEAVKQALDWCRKGAVTLLYGARDEEHNNAVVLRDYLGQHLKGR